MITRLTNWFKTQNASYEHGGDKHRAVLTLGCPECEANMAKAIRKAHEADRREREEKRYIQWVLNAMANREIDGELTDKLAEIEAEAEFLKSLDYFK